MSLSKLQIMSVQQAVLSKLHENKMTAAELERRAGLARATIGKVLNGSLTNPKLDTLNAIAKVFDCGIDELLSQRIRDKSSTPDFTEVINTLPWNNILFSKVTNATCEYLKKADENPTFEQIIKAIIEIYNYCIQKKNGTFDDSFHEWYMQKLLENLDA